MYKIKFYNKLNIYQKQIIDKILSKNKDISYYYQSYIYGEKIDFINSGKPYFFFIHKGNNITGYWLIIKCRSKCINYISWINGPIWLDNSFSYKGEAIKKIIHFFYSKKNLFIRNAKIEKKNLSYFNAKTKEVSTSFLSIEKELDTIYKSFKSNIRKNLKKVPDNVQVKVINSNEEFSEYDQMMFMERKQLKIGLPPYYPYQNWFRFFSQNYPNSYYVFKVYNNCKTLGFLGVIKYHNNIVENGLVISSYAKKNRIAVGDLLKWEIIKFFHNKGVKYYDLAGFNPHPKTQKEKGLKQYKLKWNGSVRTDYFITGLTINLHKCIHANIKS